METELWGGRAGELDGEEFWWDLTGEQLGELKFWGMEAVDWVGGAENSMNSEYVGSWYLLLIYDNELILWTDQHDTHTY